MARQHAALGTQDFSFRGLTLFSALKNANRSASSLPLVVATRTRALTNPFKKKFYLNFLSWGLKRVVLESGQEDPRIEYHRLDDSDEVAHLYFLVHDA
jgi:hypothetical protein